METSVAENPKSSNGKILPFVVGGTKQTFAQQLKSIEDQVQLQKLQLEDLQLGDGVQTLAQRIQEEKLRQQKVDDRIQGLDMVGQFQKLDDQI